MRRRQSTTNNFNTQYDQNHPQVFPPPLMEKSSESEKLGPKSSKWSKCDLFTPL